MNEIKELFTKASKATNSTLEEREEEVGEGEEGGLNLQRQPVSVYKLPVGKHDTFGQGFQGMEVAVGEVVNLSLATDLEKSTYFRLPRRQEEQEEQGGQVLEAAMLLLHSLARVVTVEKGEST